MKTRICSLALLAGVLSTSTGCSDYFNSLAPTDAVTDKMVWTDPDYATLYANNFYTYIHNFGQFGSWQCYPGITDGLTDTFKFGSPAENMTGNYYGIANRFLYGIDGQTSSSAAFYLSNWNSYYEAVRRVNEFLFSMEKYANFDEETTLRFQAEARFFRGMLYFELTKRHKEIILYDQNLEAYTPNTPLSTEEQAWKFIYQDLKFAGEHLPDVWGNADKGRVTSGAAWALLSRAMLYAERWQDAKDAADAVFESEAGYALMDGSTSEAYAKCFSTTAAQGNTESILEYTYLAGKLDHSFDYFFGPGGDGANNSRGLATPTQEMVELYEYAGGGEVDWTPWHVSGGTLVTPPYEELEPRFAATILYDGAEWKGREIEPYEGGLDGWCEFGTFAVNGMTTTGYYLRKLVDENHSDLITVNSSQPWIAIRLAEVYLNRAEAAYHLGLTELANTDLETVRGRVGLPHDNPTGDELFQAIRKERKIELAFEGHLFWDMRRWELAHKEYNGTRVHGLKIAAEAGQHRYTYVECDAQDRFFTEKYYQVPIPDDELASNRAIQQYTIWR